jgi:fumarylacetoacetase
MPLNPLTDFTHDPARRCWLASANAEDTDFPLQNLPLGRFRLPSRDGQSPGEVRVGVAIGDQVIDMTLAAHQCPWGEGMEAVLEPLARGDLAGFLAMGPRAWRTLRHALSEALVEGSDQAPFIELCLQPQAQTQMLLPCEPRDYTDFYAGIHHATTVGKLMRPDNPLLPNYKWVPIGYHGRASSVGLGGPVRRPRGQIKAGGADAPPVYAPTRRLDYELELGWWVGVGNALGETVSIHEAEQRLYGVSLLNDWSARDMQAWEYQPLGPFLAKSFCTSVSPWLVSLDALAPFRRPAVRPAGDPEPLPHLDSSFNRQHGAIDMHLEVWLQTARMREQGLPAVRLSQSNTLDAYWTPAQLLAHHTSNGCNMATGDLLGTGTLSGPGPGQGGSLLELSLGGKQVIALPGGEERSFLEDGDTVTLRAFCQAPGAVRIGLGQVSGTVQPAR